MLSMTGFGTASCEVPCGKVTIEIQSVNRKFLDLLFCLPKELSFLEPEMRSWIADRAGRGQVQIRLRWMPGRKALPLPDADELRSWRKGWRELALEIGSDPAEINISFLLSHLPSMEQRGISFSEEDREAIRACLNASLESWLEMKRREGALLQKDLCGRALRLAECLGSIEEKAPLAMERLRQRLQEKIATLLVQNAAAWEEQLGRELFFYAEKSDISEEITRLRSHLSQMERLDAGKKMEFLIQEMGREVNTIGSKAGDVEIAHLVVEMKAELEKMREQVQNIE
ncbi:MAG: YicC family protein [Verrucomicrobiota bacterium]|nr:YicC family protein [Verrucomicrobiota bacterium]